MADLRGMDRRDLERGYGLLKAEVEARRSAEAAQIAFRHPKPEGDVKVFGRALDKAWCAVDIAYKAVDKAGLLSEK